MKRLKLIFVVVLVTFGLVNNNAAEEVEVEGEANSTTTTTTSCQPRKCEDCGPNSLQCISNLSQCTLECECKEGYSGELCNLADFELLKKKAWSNLVADLNASSNNTMSLASYETLLKRLCDLVDDLVRQNDLDENDAEQINRILEVFLRINHRKPYPNSERSIRCLFTLVDRLIRRSVNAGEKFGVWVHKVLLNVDRFSKYFSLGNNNDDETIRLEFDSFEALVMRYEQSNLEFKSKRNDSMISLNSNLKERLSNRTGNIVVFKIIYNYPENQVEKSNVEQNNNAKNLYYSREKINVENYFVSPNVLSVVVENDGEQPVEENLVRIEFTIDMARFGLKPFMEKQLICKHWDPAGYWSPSGCHTSNVESGFIPNTDLHYRKVCYCNHLSDFAVLFDTTDQHSSYYYYYYFLPFMIYIGVSVAVFCYLVLIMSRFFCFRSYSDRVAPFDKSLSYIYLFISICLLLANLLFLAVLKLKSPISQLTNNSPCLISASLFHFFLSSSFCFSFAASWLHYKKLVRIYQNDEIVVLKWTLFSILFPLILSLSGFYSHRSHDLINSTNCWFKQPLIYYYFVLPISILLFLSLIFYLFVTIRVLTIYKYFNLGRKQDSESSSGLNHSYNHRRVIVLLSSSFVALGLSWSIGILIALLSHAVDVNVKLFMEFLFFVSNSFHALCLLIGNLLAKKYTNNSSTVESIPRDEPMTRDMGIKMTCSVRFFICVYGLRYRIRRLLGFKSSVRRGDHDNPAPNFIEFYVASYSPTSTNDNNRIEITSGQDWIDFKNDDLY